MTIEQAFHLAVEHHQAGRLAEAESLYRQILAGQPNHADALQLLGVIAHQAGLNDVAEQMIRQALVLHPNNANARANLGAVLYALGKWEEAIASYRGALQLDPTHIDAHNNLSNALHERGVFDKAAEEARQAIALKPDYAEAHNNLGNALLALSQRKDAISAYRRAIALRQDFAVAHSNLGNALRDQGQLDEAVAACRRAIEIEPDFAIAHNNLGNALRDEGQVVEAIAAYRRARELQPDFVEAYNNLGSALRAAGQLDEAIAACHRALELKADYPDAHHNLSNALRDQGRSEEALAAFRRALKLNPNDARIHSDLILLLHFLPDEDVTSIAAEQRRWNQHFGVAAKPRTRPHANPRGPERRLKLGYVSADFRNHAVGWSILPLFECHDRRRFEILCYSGVTQQDKITEEFQRHADHWRSTVRVPNEQFEEMIRRDEVDILVDLSQHSGGNRLPVFARQPAPVQVSFAGYPESAGVEAIHYRISDRYLESESELKVDAEMKGERVFVIESFWCYHPRNVEIAPSSLPANQNGRVTFGNLSHLCKINEPLLKLWARVLAQVDGSRLILLDRERGHQEQTRKILEREGIESQRIEFVEPCPRRMYFELYHRLDIVLDTFPYTGHNTSLDALWMGVPVVSLAGKTAVSRGGLSILSNLGLPELVADDKDEYIGIAVRLAHDLPRLAELRSSLRGRMEASVLMDSRRFTSGIEMAYRAMWQEWCTENTSA